MLFNIHKYYVNLSLKLFPIVRLRWAPYVLWGDKRLHYSLFIIISSLSQIICSLKHSYAPVLITVKLLKLAGNTLHLHWTTPFSIAYFSLVEKSPSSLKVSNPFKMKPCKLTLCMYAINVVSSDETWFQPTKNLSRYSMMCGYLTASPFQITSEIQVW